MILQTTASREYRRGESMDIDNLGGGIKTLY
jgi:hypothetical protein